MGPLLSSDVGRTNAQNARAFQNLIVQFHLCRCAENSSDTIIEHPSSALGCFPIAFAEHMQLGSLHTAFNVDVES